MQEVDAEGQVPSRCLRTFYSGHLTIDTCCSSAINVHAAPNTTRDFEDHGRQRSLHVEYLVQHV